MTAAEIARLLADRIAALAPELLPGGHREAQEWRCGSIAGEAGHSLGVHLAGAKSGVWSDFSAGHKGDALDLVRACLGLEMAEAMAWARRWLGVDEGKAALPPRRVSSLRPAPDNPDRWRRPWRAERPIAGTLAETYLASRGLAFDDRDGRVLRFAARRCRLAPAGDFEHHPALLAALCDVRSGEQCGIVNIFLEADGRDRLRDRKAKTCTGRAGGAAVMLDAFESPTTGLAICEGLETGLAVRQSGLRPIWALGGAGNLAKFPVLGSIEALTIAADRDDAGIPAARELARRWRDAGRQALIVAPPAGDWADDGGRQ